MRPREGWRSHDGKARQYRCFLIRCWQVEAAKAGDEPVWRFTVKEAGDGMLGRSFPCLTDVETYLETELKVRGAGSLEKKEP